MGHGLLTISEYVPYPIMQNIVQHNYIKLFVVIRNFIFFSIHTRGINEF